MRSTILDASTDYRYVCLSNRVRVGTGQFFYWMDGFTNNENALKSTVYLLPFASKNQFH